jgi:hypothetical protein
MKTSIAAAAAAFVLAAAAPTASAGHGDRVVVVDSASEIVLTYLDGGGAGNTNLLFLDSPFSSTQIFSNRTNVAGDTFSLGLVSAGTELVFRLNSEASDDWFSGPASRNDDNFAHAVVTDLGNQTVQVAFEDLRDGGDRNFADMVFSVGNATLAPVPEPQTYALMLAGLGLVAWGSRRRMPV